MSLDNIDPPITSKEIADADDHHGRNKSLKLLLQTLLGLKAFNANSYKELGNCMYALEEDRPLYGAERLERFRRGTASPITREAQYFHDGFAHVFSEMWASQISLEQLINEPLNDLIGKLQANYPLDLADPTRLAFMLNSMNTNDVFDFEFVCDGFRWGDHNETQEDPYLESDIPSLKTGALFTLNLNGVDSENPPLILQIADETIIVDGKLTRAQKITQTRIEEGSLAVLSANGALIKASNIVGRFHYLALPRDQTHDQLPAFLTEMELKSVLGNSWRQAMSGDKFSSSLVTYRVEGP